MAVIGIKAISVEIPETRVQTAPMAERLQIDDTTLNDRIGVKRIARKDPGQDTSDLCIAAAHKLFAGGAVRPDDVDCLIVVTQNPDGYGLPQTSSIIHGRLRLSENCAAFDIGLGCSGFVYGLAVAKAFMEAQGLRCGLLCTADPYSKIIDENDRRTALLFGDAAAVTLLTGDPVWHIGRFDMGTSGSRGDVLEVSRHRNGKLYMDGRAVLAFCKDRVPHSILRALQLNGTTLDAIDRIVLHQGSRVVIDSIGEALGAPEKCMFYAADYGNTVSSSIPVILQQNVPSSDQRLLISGFGVGLSWASTVLTRSAA